MTGGTGNQPLLLALGGSALRSVDHLTTYFVVQHRHPDGRRWVDLARFASHGDAAQAIRDVVAAGYAAAGELRVRKITREMT
jgi:hypothetical protein